MALRTIDADAHVIETPYTFDFMEKGEEKWKPLVTSQIAGATQLSNEGNVRKDYWIVDNNAYAKDRNVDSNTAEEHREMRDVKGRVKHMDELEIDVQVLFPTLFLRPCTDRMEVESALFRSYNRWLVEIWKKAGGRLRWVAMAPLRSTPAEVERELRFCKEHGACGIFMRPFELEGNVSDVKFFPLYKLAGELDMPLCWHAGNGSFQIHDYFFPINLPIHKLSMVATFHELLMSEVPKKFPNTKWAFIEASAQWIPYAMNDLWIRKRKSGKRMDKDPMKDNNIWVAVQVHDDFEWVLKYASEDRLVVGTDYGHTDTSAEIEALRLIKDQGKIPPHVAEKILGPNAAELYGLN
jgi:predicted TIM-barrel fold metal-dependent hydrolase